MTQQTRPSDRAREGVNYMPTLAATALTRADEARSVTQCDASRVPSGQATVSVRHTEREHIMSKATVITSDAMARQTDPDLPEETVKGKRPPTVASVVKAIEAVRAEFGTPSQAESSASKATATLEEIRKSEQEARDTLRKSERGVRKWQSVAYLSEQSGQSAREFGRLAGGNPNTRGRLLRARSILVAAHDAKVTVPFWQAVADGNASSVKRAEAVVASLANGVDPYATVKTTETGKAHKAPRDRRPKVYRIADAAETVRAFTALVPKDESLTDAQWADLDKAVRAFALAVSKRAGTARKHTTTRGKPAAPRTPRTSAAA